MLKTVRILSPVLLTLLLIGGCANTRLKSTWKDPAYSFTSMRKVLVMGIGPAEKQSLQRVIEDAFVKNMAERGAQGIPSYTLAPANGKLDEAGWKRLIAENNISAVLVTRLVDTKTVEREVPPTTTTVSVGGHPAGSYNGGFIGSPGTYNPSAMYNAGWYGYYQSNYQVMSTPGYTVKDQYAVIDTKLFDVASAKLVWTASSDTLIGPNQDSDALARQFAKIVTDAIYKP